MTLGEEVMEEAWEPGAEEDPGSEFRSFQNLLAGNLEAALEEKGLTINPAGTYVSWDNQFDCISHQLRCYAQRGSVMSRLPEEVQRRIEEGAQSSVKVRQHLSQWLKDNGEQLFLEPRGMNGEEAMEPEDGLTLQQALSQRRVPNLDERQWDVYCDKLSRSTGENMEEWGNILTLLAACYFYLLRVDLYELNEQDEEVLTTAQRAAKEMCLNPLKIEDEGRIQLGCASVHYYFSLVQKIDDESQETDWGPEEASEVNHDATKAWELAQRCLFIQCSECGEFRKCDETTCKFHKKHKNEPWTCKDGNRNGTMTPCEERCEDANWWHIVCYDFCQDREELLEYLTVKIGGKPIDFCYCFYSAYALRSKKDLDKTGFWEWLVSQNGFSAHSALRRHYPALKHAYEKLFWLENNGQELESFLLDPEREHFAKIKRTAEHYKEQIVANFIANRPEKPDPADTLAEDELTDLEFQMKQAPVFFEKPALPLQRPEHAFALFREVHERAIHYRDLSKQLGSDGWGTGFDLLAQQTKVQLTEAETVAMTGEKKAGKTTMINRFCKCSEPHPEDYKVMNTHHKSPEEEDHVRVFRPSHEMMQAYGKAAMEQESKATMQWKAYCEFRDWAKPIPHFFPEGSPTGSTTGEKINLKVGPRPCITIHFQTKARAEAVFKEYQRIEIRQSDGSGCRRKEDDERKSAIVKAAISLRGLPQSKPLDNAKSKKTVMADLAKGDTQWLLTDETLCGLFGKSLVFDTRGRNMMYDRVWGRKIMHWIAQQPDPVHSGSDSSTNVNCSPSCGSTHPFMGPSEEDALTWIRKVHELIDFIDVELPSCEQSVLIPRNYVLQDIPGSADANPLKWVVRKKALETAGFLACIVEGNLEESSSELHDDIQQSKAARKLVEDCIRVARRNGRETASTNDLERIRCRLIVVHNCEKNSTLNQKDRKPADLQAQYNRAKEQSQTKLFELFQDLAQGMLGSETEDPLAEEAALLAIKHTPLATSHISLFTSLLMSENRDPKLENEKDKYMSTTGDQMTLGFFDAFSIGQVLQHLEQISSLLADDGTLIQEMRDRLETLKGLEEGLADVNGTVFHGANGGPERKQWIEHYEKSLHPSFEQTIRDGFETLQPELVPKANEERVIAKLQPFFHRSFAEVVRNGVIQAGHVQVTKHGSTFATILDGLEIVPAMVAKLVDVLRLAFLELQEGLARSISTSFCHLPGHEGRRHVIQKAVESQILQRRASFEQNFKSKIQSHAGRMLDRVHHDLQIQIREEKVEYTPEAIVRHFLDIVCSDFKTKAGNVLFQRNGLVPGLLSLVKGSCSDETVNHSLFDQLSAQLLLNSHPSKLRQTINFQQGFFSKLIHSVQDLRECLEKLKGNLSAGFTDFTAASDLEDGSSRWEDYLTRLGSSMVQDLRSQQLLAQFWKDTHHRPAFQTPLLNCGIDMTEKCFNPSKVSDKGYVLLENANQLANFIRLCQEAKNIPNESLTRLNKQASAHNLKGRTTIDIKTEFFHSGEANPEMILCRVLGCTDPHPRHVHDLRRRVAKTILEFAKDKVPPMIGKYLQQEYKGVDGLKRYAHEVLSESHVFGIVEMLLAFTHFDIPVHIYNLFSKYDRPIRYQTDPIRAAEFHSAVPIAYAGRANRKTHPQSLNKDPHFCLFMELVKKKTQEDEDFDAPRRSSRLGAGQKRARPGDEDFVTPRSVRLRSLAQPVTNSSDYRSSAVSAGAFGDTPDLPQSVDLKSNVAVDPTNREEASRPNSLLQDDGGSGTARQEYPFLTFSHEDWQKESSTQVDAPDSAPCQNLEVGSDIYKHRSADLNLRLNQVQMRHLQSRFAQFDKRYLWIRAMRGKQEKYAQIEGLHPDHLPCDDHAHSTSNFLCVLDGVGSKGPPSGEFARKLGHYIQELSQSPPMQSEPRVQEQNFNLSRQYVECAYDKLYKEGRVGGSRPFFSSGACTVLLVTLVQNKMHAQIHGDCQFALMRRQGECYECYYLSRPVYYPPHMCRTQTPRQLHCHHEKESVTSQGVWKERVEEGDIVVAGSDGFFDNLAKGIWIDGVLRPDPNFRPDHFLTKTVTKCYQECTVGGEGFVGHLGEALKLHCLEIMDGQRGKPDDVSLVVASITKEPAWPYGESISNNHHPHNADRGQAMWKKIPEVDGFEEQVARVHKSGV